MALSHNTQFWILQAIGWSLWVLLLVVRDLTFVPVEYIFDRAVVFALDAMFGVILTTGMRYIYRAVWDASGYVRIASVPLCCLLASVIWMPVKRLIVSTEFGAAVDLVGYGWLPFINLMPVTFTLLLVWSVLYFCIKYYQYFQLEKEKYLRSEALAREAQLRMLRYQLNPHFLFNTLNAISTLVMQGASDAANRMLTKLSIFLRYSLEHDPLEQVDLAREIRSVQLYLAIEKVRFEERLQIALNISPEAEKALVPSMLLQPLVENSIKYAVSRSESGGSITITGTVEQDRLHLSVADDGPGSDHERAGERDLEAASCGVGLSNIQNRLAELYDRDFTLALGSRESGGFEVTVIIPYETK